MTLSMRHITLGGAVIVLSSVELMGATYLVKPDGTGDFPTIQAAVNNAATNDVIQLDSGTFTGAGNYNISFAGKAITVESVTGNPADCIIDCGGNGRGFTFETDEDLDSVLRGVTIANGYAGTSLGSVGGGIRCGRPGIPPIIPNRHGSPTIEDCVIINCTSVSGGGMSCTTDSAPMILDTRFEGNQLDTFVIGNHFGAGLYCLDAAPTLIRCRFLGNINDAAASVGGGMYVASATPYLHECVFDSNEANTGGGLAIVGALPVVEECTFQDNVASSEGGAVYCAGSLTNPVLTNCTMYANAAGFIGGAGISAQSFAHPQLVRSIIAMSTDGDAAFAGGSASVTITCCDIYGNDDGPGAVGGQIGSNNNFAEWPGFCDPETRDLTIRSESGCAPANNPCSQLVGSQGVGCSSPLLYDVCPTGAADFDTIQVGVDACIDGDTVLLCDGTYTGPRNRDVDFGGRILTVQSESDDPSLCIIDCQADADDPHRAFVLGAGAGGVIRGLTITNGYVTQFGGGAIWCDDGASPGIENCVLTGNQSELAGGAVAGTDGSTPTIIDCEITNNTSESHGGGVVSEGDGMLVIMNCFIAGNNAGDDGGGVAAFSPSQIQNTTFRQNSSVSFGGGLAAFDPSTLDTCSFIDNFAGQGNLGRGGAVWWGGGSATTCTFHGNAAVSEGGAIYGSVDLVSCTLNENDAPLGSAINGSGTADRSIMSFHPGGPAVIGSLTITCCDVYGNAGGPGSVAPQIGLSGNIALDPIYCDPPVLDFTIRGDSPCRPFSPPNPECDLIGAWPVGCLAPCPEDCAMPQDDEVDIIDLLDLLSQWGSTGSCDIDGDGIVNVVDLLALLAEWGACD